MALRSRTVATLPGVLALSPACTSAKPILKRAGRPSPLPLSPSPFPFSAGFTAMLSVSARSPHVHFPPSPLLHSVISIQSALSSSSSFACRSLSPTSPNTVEIGAQEATIPPSPYSFSAFKLADAPKPPKKAQKEVVTKEKPAATAAAVAAVHFEDPRSPRPTSVTSLGAAALKLGSRKPRTSDLLLYKALTTFPRSPYPSAPAQQEDASSEEAGGFPNDLVVISNNNSSGGPGPKRRNSESAVPTPPPRARSLGARNTNHHSITSKPTSSSSSSSSSSRTRAIAPPPLDLLWSFSGTVVPTTSRLSPVKEDNDTNTSPASALNNAFWQSVSLDLEGLPLSGSDGGDFPESVSSEVSLDIGRALLMEPVRTPQLPRTVVVTMPPKTQPELLFADGNGNLWSPGLPKQEHAAGSRGLDGVVVVPQGVRKSTLTAPSPKDPRAKFPSFSTAFGVVQMIRPPVRAHLAA